jgi:hypothetical protein
MAIPPMEIRYRKSLSYFTLGLFGVFFVTMPFTVFVSGRTKAGPAAYLTCFAWMIVLAFIGLRMYRRVSSREPILVFTSEGLQIPMKNNLFIQWGSITKWTIRNDKSSHYLIIYTPEGRTRIDISWLDLPVKEIQRLMSSYIRQPGPHGFLR